MVERLPPYAYDLNPLEQVWGNLKGTELANYCPDTTGEAAEIVDNGLCRIGNETEFASLSYATAASSYNLGPRGITRRSLAVVSGLDLV